MDHWRNGLYTKELPEKDEKIKASRYDSSKLTTPAHLIDRKQKVTKETLEINERKADSKNGKVIFGKRTSPDDHNS